MTSARILMAMAVALALAACANATTEQIGTTINAEGSQTAPGSNSFRIVFDPTNPGIPLEAYVVSFKDEDNVRIAISYPDGTRWEYTADTATSSKQTAAVVATQQAVAALQAETGQVLGQAAIAAVEGAVRRSLGVPLP